MVGSIDIKLQTPQIVYSFTLERNLTIIRGDGGSGKSYLCELIEQASQGIEDVHLLLSREVSYLVLPRDTSDSRTTLPWDKIIANCNNTIIFIDETCDCWKSGYFSKAIQNTTNYYVIFSRNTHADLPYSSKSILYFKKDVDRLIPRISGKQFYPELNSTVKLHPDLLVTEDEKAGFVFYKHAFDIEVSSAKSKTKICKKLKSLAAHGQDNILLIVDGAAFGPEIEQVSTLLEACFNSSYVYLPESFEWLLLHSPLFHDAPEITSILLDFTDIIDWSQYFSAEQFFTAQLKTLTNDLNMIPYTKSAESLDSKFLEPDTLQAIKSLIPIDENDSQVTNYFGGSLADGKTTST